MDWRSRCCAVGARGVGHGNKDAMRGSCSATIRNVERKSNCRCTGSRKDSQGDGNQTSQQQIPKLYFERLRMLLFCTEKKERSYPFIVYQILRWPAPLDTPQSRFQSGPCCLSSSLIVSLSASNRVSKSVTWALAASRPPALPACFIAQATVRKASPSAVAQAPLILWACFSTMRASPAKRYNALWDRHSQTGCRR